MREPVGTREITSTRVYDAPRPTVFAMWTEAEHLARWWGPDGFSAPRVTSDPRPGGTLTIVMAGPDFEETMQARYREVVAPERIVVDSVVPGPDGQPFLESSHTVTFADLGDRTEVTVTARAAVFAAAGLGALDGMQAGWNQSLQCLDDALTGAAGRQVLLTRLYDAAPDAVFALWEDPAHLERWWGPDGSTLTVDEIEVRPGGRWRFTMHGPDGRDHPDRVTFEEVVRGRRLVYTHGEPSDPEPPSTAVVTFDEVAGRTALSMRLVFASAEARDLVVDRHDPATGASQALDRLAGLVETTAT